MDRGLLWKASAPPTRRDGRRNLAQLDQWPTRRRGAPASIAARPPSGGAPDSPQSHDQNCAASRWRFRAVRRQRRRGPLQPAAVRDRPQGAALARVEHGAAARAERARRRGGEEPGARRRRRPRRARRDAGVARRPLVELPAARGGRRRAAAVRAPGRLAPLNPHVAVAAAAAGPSTPSGCANTVVAVDRPLDEQLALDAACRAAGSPRARALGGLFGSVFGDLGDAFEVDDADGEPPRQALLEHAGAAEDARSSRCPSSRTAGRRRRALRGRRRDEGAARRAAPPSASSTATRSASATRGLGEARGGRLVQVKQRRPSPRAARRGGGRPAAHIVDVGGASARRRRRRTRASALSTRGAAGPPAAGCAESAAHPRRRPRRRRRAGRCHRRGRGARVRARRGGLALAARRLRRRRRAGGAEGVHRRFTPLRQPLCADFADAPPARCPTLMRARGAASTASGGARRSAVRAPRRPARLRRRRRRNRLRAPQVFGADGRRHWRRRRGGGDGHGHDRAVEPQPPIPLPSRRRRQGQVGVRRRRVQGHQPGLPRHLARGAGRRRRRAVRRGVLARVGHCVQRVGQCRGSAVVDRQCVRYGLPLLERHVGDEGNVQVAVLYLSESYGPTTTRRRRRRRCARSSRSRTG